MKFSVAAFAIAASVGLSACQPTPVSVSAPSGSSILNVVNTSSSTVFYIQLSPCSSNEWGPDRLGSDEIVSSGSSRAFTLQPGCWDMRASDDVTNPNGEKWVQRNVNLTGGSFDWTLF